MKHLPLFPGASASTNLGFGTTSLMGLVSSKERLNLLETAFEFGIRHYDTAPYYGYGEAERVLGEFMVGKRDQLTVTTKYGIKAPAVLKSRTVNRMARQLLRLFPGMRQMLSRRVQALTPKSRFTATEARASLERSLGALKTDHVDLFLLHEPEYADAAAEEMRGFLEYEVERGTIRAYGCGGEFEVIQKIATSRLPTAAWLQFEDNVLSRRIEEILATGSNCITFRTFHQALAALTDWLETDPSRYGEWGGKLQMDLRADGNLAGLLQAASHARNPDGIVLFSTRRADRIRAAAQVASGDQFSTEQIDTLGSLTANLI